MSCDGQPPVSSIPLPLTSVRRFKVVAALEERGHRAHAIDLPGHEADSTPAATVTLEDYVRAIGAALRARGGGITQ